MLGFIDVQGVLAQSRTIPPIQTVCYQSYHIYENINDQYRIKLNTKYILMQHCILLAKK